MACCQPGINDVFTDAVSRKDANRYRRRGLPKRARKLLAAIESALSLKGRRTLEIGVGVGAVTIEMLQRGAASAIGVDAVAAQLAYARELAAEKGVADRLELIQSEFSASTRLGNADVVLLDRVVCCYPDWRGLLSAAASHANAALALTYPRDTWWLKLGWRVANFWFLLTRNTFRLHVHPPHDMHALLAQSGLQPRVVGRYWGWEIALAVRS